MDHPPQTPDLIPNRHLPTGLSLTHPKPGTPSRKYIYLLAVHPELFSFSPNHPHSPHRALNLMVQPLLPILAGPSSSSPLRLELIPLSTPQPPSTGLSLSSRPQLRIYPQTDTPFSPFQSCLLSRIYKCPVGAGYGRGVPSAYRRQCTVAVPSACACACVPCRGRVECIVQHIFMNKIVLNISRALG